MNKPEAGRKNSAFVPLSGLNFNSSKLKENIYDHSRLIPVVLIILLAGLAPFLSALYNSFTYNGVFSGFKSYRSLMADKGFPMAVGISIVWSFLSASCTMILAFPLASFVIDNKKAYNILFPVLVIIWAVPIYIGAPLWRFVLHGAAGDSIWKAITGIKINLMEDAFASFISTALVASWFRLPQAVFIIIAALGRSRKTIDDAAKLDGAGPLAIALHLRLPAMSGVLAACSALELVSAFKEFTVPFLMTAGGPPLKAGITERTVIGATTTLEVYLYDMFSHYANESVVSAYAVVLSLAIGLIVSLIYIIKANPKKISKPFAKKSNKTDYSTSRKSLPIAGKRADFVFFVINWLFILLLLLTVLALLYALLWMAFSKLSIAFIDSPLPGFFTASNFRLIFERDGLGRIFANTVFVSGLSAILIGFFAFPAAAWLADRSTGKILAFFVALQALSSAGGVHSLIPLYDLWRKLGLLGGYTPVILVYLYHSLPAALFAMTAFLRDQPKAFLDVSRLEGQSRLAYLLSIQLPMSLPIIGAGAMLAFLSAWNGFLAPLVFLNDDSTYTVAIKLHSYVGSIASGSPKWNLFAAASIVNIIIVGLLFSRFKKPLTKTALSDELED